MFLRNVGIYVRVHLALLSGRPIMTYKGLYRLGFDSRQGKRNFPVSRPALKPTQPPVQWVPGVLSPVQSATGACR
jgi:hypothetical protein